MAIGQIRFGKERDQGRSTGFSHGKRCGRRLEAPHAVLLAKFLRFDARRCAAWGRSEIGGLPILDFGTGGGGSIDAIFAMQRARPTPESLSNPSLCEDQVDRPGGWSQGGGLDLPKLKKWTWAGQATGPIESIFLRRRARHIFDALEGPSSCEGRLDGSHGWNGCGWSGNLAICQI